MANTINYVERYSAELDQALRQGSLTAEIETPRVNWMGAKTFQVPSISVTGLQPHSRNGGFNRGNVDVTHEPYTLGFDRDVEYFVDRADVDESGDAASSANVVNVFLTENAAPEIDAYRFSKMATAAIASGQSDAEAIDKTNVYTKLKAAILPMRKYGPGNLVMYVSSAVMDALEMAEDFTRQITVQGNGPGVLESRITAIDGVRLIEVWDFDRFHTKFDFTDGFVPSTGVGSESYAINFLLVAKPAVIAKAKIDYSKVWEPGTHTQGDGYLYQHRLYHDLFVMKNKADGIYVSHVVAANA